MPSLVHEIMYLNPVFAPIAGMLVAGRKRPAIYRFFCATRCLRWISRFSFVLRSSFDLMRGFRTSVPRVTIVVLFARRSGRVSSSDEASVLDWWRIWKLVTDAFCPSPVSSAFTPLAEKELLSRTTVSRVLFFASALPKASAKSSSSFSLVMVTLVTVLLVTNAVPVLVRSCSSRPRKRRFSVRSTSVIFLSLFDAIASKSVSISLRLRALSLPFFAKCWRRATRSLSRLLWTVLAICCFGIPPFTRRPTWTRLGL
mmetsp:Transcript_4717/g.12092  ORF Transcript_4717/g.12092 Transcript_4717/m.12092 type:complete len:256 (+) Transcript_4717:781-1548(+)